MTLAATAAALCTMAGSAHAAQPIFGGSEVETCGWPSAVFLGACSGTLIHPSVVVLAAHCFVHVAEPPTTVLFGENGEAPAREVALSSCTPHADFTGKAGTDDANDIAVCTLESPVDDVPIVPVLMGCEADALVEGGATTLVGFGFTDTDAFGIKHAVATTIESIGNTAIWLGDAAGTACNGDSGGPAFVQIDDGTWRVFGATSGASDPEAPCPQTAVYTLLHPHVPWIESTTGIDVTPCYDPDGTWDPNEACGGFPLDPATASGDWSDGCGGGESSSWSQTCGPPFEASGSEDTSGGETSSASGVDDGSDDDGGATSEGTASTGIGPTSGASSADGGSADTADDDAAMENAETGGCGCSPTRRADGLAIVMIVVTLASRRRRLAER